MMLLITTAPGGGVFEVQGEGPRSLKHTIKQPSCFLIARSFASFKT